MGVQSKRKSRRSRQPFSPVVGVEWLMDRILPAASPLDLATPLHFSAFNSVQLSQRFLSQPTELDLYSTTLQAGDTITAGIVAQSNGALASVLQVLRPNGTQLALNNQEGGDPHLTFQAATSGTYYIGVSSANNTTGLYELNVRRTLAAPLLPDMAGSSFRTGLDMAASGDTIPVNFSIENRGGADPGKFQVEVLLSRSNRFDSSSQVLATLTRAQLIANPNGRGFATPSGFSVTLPPGLASGNAFLGLRIVSDPRVADSGLYDKSAVHRGEDWENLTLLTRASAGATDLSKVDAGLRTLETGTNSGTYAFTVTSEMGNGQLTAEVASRDSLLPRLTISAATGQKLLQSDSGRIVQALVPGTYLLTVTPISSAGTFRLDTSFTPASPLLTPLPGGSNQENVLVCDLTNNGIVDLVVSNYNDSTISVFRGNGDGTFQPRQIVRVPEIARWVEIADLNGDGILDLVTGNYRAGTVGILLGNGDGTFQPESELESGLGPWPTKVADLNGDGFPDIAVGNYSDNSVRIFLGNGDGSFQTGNEYPVGTGPRRLELTDLNGDGIPDITTINEGGNDVSVLKGNGDGTFQPAQSFPAGGAPYSITVGDVNGDGKPDLAVGDYSDNTVSILLGNGDGSFQTPHQTPPTGLVTETVDFADLNGDGTLDLVVNSSNGVSVLRGVGDGTFQLQQVLPVTPDHGLNVADLNGDGQPDIIHTGFNPATAEVELFLGNGDGTFQARQGVPPPGRALSPAGLLLADLNGDGLDDLVIINSYDNSVSILIQNRDGTFQARRTFPVGLSPDYFDVADLNGDGIPDIVCGPYKGQTISVVLGNGDGTFQAPTFFDAGDSPQWPVVADFNGDGKPDIAVVDYADATVSVLLGNGDGTFQPRVAYDVGLAPELVVAATLAGDRIPDLVVLNRQGRSVSILLGKGDGTFQPQTQYPVATDPGNRAQYLAVADLNGDDISDIVVTKDLGVDILLGNSDGTFQPRNSILVSPSIREAKPVAIGDLNRDGKPDLVVANEFHRTIDVLLGNGDGTFTPLETIPLPDGAGLVKLTDLDRDGVLDLLVFSGRDTVRVLHGRGDGTFGPPTALRYGPTAYSSTVADVNGDGKPDLLQSSRYNGTVSVQLGTGTGTFTKGASLSVGSNPLAIASADLNRDDRQDVVTSNSGDNTVSVLLGNGDGTFQAQQTYPTGRNPRGVSLADVNGDGIPDITVANYDDNTVSVLMGNGDGTFRSQQVFAAGDKPYAVKVAKLAGDGRPDIIVTDAAGDAVAVLLGNGQGGFAPGRSLATGRQPFSLDVADVNGDGIPDIVVGNYADNTVSLLLGLPNGAFAPQEIYKTGTGPNSLTIADVNGDGRLDIITANTGDNTSSVLLNNGNGTFQPPVAFATGKQPSQTLVSDVNGDGLPDLVNISTYTPATSVLLNLGNDNFAPLSQANAVTLSSTPYLVDLTGNGIADTVILDGSGNILFRKGLGGASNAFAPPVILNPGHPARDIAIVRTGTGLAIAAADAHYDPAQSHGQFIFDISLYSVTASGTIVRTVATTLPAPPIKISAGDLTIHGRDDLIIANSLNDSVSISIQLGPGVFSAPNTIRVGGTPSAISVLDVNHDGLPDVVVTNQSSGDITVLLNDPNHSFTHSLRFATGTEPSTLSGTTISSITAPVAFATGAFLRNGQVDLALINRGTHAINLLAANGSGFASPSLATATSTSDSTTVNAQPSAVVAGDFNLDGKLDLAVLMQDTGQLWIFSGKGDGTFSHTFTIPVGDGASGLSVAQGSRPGLLNLLVGNSFGDVLILDGKGDGTFQITGKRVSLSVVPDLLGPGQAGVLVGNQQSNTVTVQAPSGSGGQYTTVSSLGSANSTSQLAPGSVEWSILDKNATLPDAIVVSTGSNAVVVYRTLSISGGSPIFANPQTYFVGTAPAGVTIADLNGDGIPDMVVANQGSNDVSVIFGGFDARGNWVGTAGPRLKAGGAGPTGAIVSDLSGDGIPDLAIINGDSGTITMLPGVGKGFFNDQTPTTLFHLGSSLVQPPTFVGSSHLGYAVTSTGDLLRFDLSNPSAGADVVYSGKGVQAARALANGQVAVALFGGIVDLLSPLGNNLVVTTHLQSPDGLAALPSSLDVIKNADGHYNVLVSSQGSSTIFVYNQSDTFAPSGGGSSPPTFPSSPQATSSASTAAGVFVGNITNAAATIQGSTTANASTSTSSLSTSATVSTAGVTNGLSLGRFSTLATAFAKVATSVMLVAVEGNSYLNVPLLDFGADQEIEAERNSIPGLGMKYPLGDTSPLTRFISGLDEALRDYRGNLVLPAPTTLDHISDPWYEDLFVPRQNQSPLFDDEALIEHPADPIAANAEPEPVEPAEPVSPGINNLAGIVVGCLLLPTISKRLRKSRQAFSSREHTR